MTIYTDNPRRYKKRGKRWAHVFGDTVEETKAFGKQYGLKRPDPMPFFHYDVTDVELQALRSRGIDITNIEWTLETLTNFRGRCA